MRIILRQIVRNKGWWYLPLAHSGHCRLTKFHSKSWILPDTSEVLVYNAPWGTLASLVGGWADLLLAYV